MKLEKFNHYGKFIDFDPIRKKWMESNNADEQNRLSGVGDLFGSSCVAMVVRNGGLLLYIDQIEFDLADSKLKLHYEHHEDGTTTFSAADSVNTAKITYVSWWRTTPPGVAGLGSSADEDEDICAYILFMTSEESRKNHLINKYA